ncbi:PhyH-domain-containing protein [Lophium mytilinum]|uniref:PhyH-domain-containing protein n=1 Tax=Lophium mytilinum TaxID=390894 RepID=A0A6A6QHP4_9PEZI|nr:PhyH-domain-containing protein [Lophium mytilinum]
MAPALLRNDSYDLVPRVSSSSSRCKVNSIPKVSVIDLNTYETEEHLTDDIISSLKVSGGCIIRNMYQQSTLDAMEQEIRPYINATGKATNKREDFVPSSTKLVTGLLSKSRTYALSVAGNKAWRTVCDHFLTSTLSNSWHGTQSRTSTSAPQLSTTVTFSISPGTPAQGLHRDDDIYHTQHPASPTHHLGRDTMLCLFVAGAPCTPANGATRFVPGSHLWDYRIPPPAYNPDNPLFAHAAMQPGDAFMMLGGTYHGAGANTTQGEERLVYAAFATRGYLRQEENQYLANDLERIRELPVGLQRWAGFGASKPFMGWVDMEEPVRLLSGEGVDVGEVEFW